MRRPANRPKDPEGAHVSKDHKELIVPEGCGARGPDGWRGRLAARDGNLEGIPYGELRDE
jgi:hypothetical protein